MKKTTKKTAVKAKKTTQSQGKTAGMESIPFDREDLDFLRDLAKQHQLQYFNARFVQAQSTSLSLLNRVSKASNSGIGHGFSIQAFTNGGWGLACGQGFDRAQLEETFSKAAQLAQWSSKRVKESFQIQGTDDTKQAYTISQQKPLISIGPDEKIRDLLDFEQSAYYDPRVVSTRVSYGDSIGEMIQFNSSGRFTRGHVAGLYLNIQVVAKDGSNQQSYHASAGGSGGYEIFRGAHEKAKETASKAVELLSSKPVKPGTFDIIMDPALNGTFIHEAMGHAMEADAVLAGESIVANKIGERIGSELVNIYDDGTLQSGYGFIPYDDEGIPGQKTLLVEKGVLKGFMHSLETASKMHCSPTGNCRAMGYSHTPIVRMTNTYLAPGDSSLDEMIKEMKNGLLMVGWRYGYTDPTDGRLVFKSSSGYLIQNGEKVQIIRDAAISGMTLDILNRITLVGNDMALDPGHCGKDGQSVPVGSGGPHVYIKDCVIGGEE